MTHSAPSISRPTANAYRATSAVHRCLTHGCEEAAVVRCLSCGATHCTSHALGDSYCADCEMALSNTEVRAGWVGAALAVVAGGATMYLSGLNNLVLTATLGGCYSLLAVWTTAIGRALARRSFKAGDKFPAAERLLEQAELKIAPQIGPRSTKQKRRRVAGAGGASPGATPTPPMYARTYGVG